MGLRKEKRVKAILPVRLSGTDADGKAFATTAHTLDISRTGARLGSPTHAPAQGTEVSLQYRTSKARFRVQWVRGEGKEMQIGVQALDPDRSIWGLQLPQLESDEYVTLRKARRYERRAEERRRHRRYPVSGTVQVFAVRGSELGRQAILGDISHEGCYLETPTPAAPNTLLRLLIKVENIEIEAVGAVRTAYPQAGMGVQFTSLSAPDKRRLEELIGQASLRTSAYR